MVDSPSVMHELVLVFFACPSARQSRLGPFCRARLGKVGTGALATARNGCAGAGWPWLVVCRGAQTQSRSDPHQSIQSIN